MDGVVLFIGILFGLATGICWRMSQYSYSSHARKTFLALTLACIIAFGVFLLLYKISKGG